MITYKQFRLKAFIKICPSIKIWYASKHIMQLLWVGIPSIQHCEIDELLH